MRHLLLALTLALPATLLSAQSAPPRTFSPTFASLEFNARSATSDLPMFAINPVRETGRVSFDIGSLVVTGGSTNVRIAWLPILAPLPGSVPTTTSVMPDPFTLNHVELPWRKGLRPRVQ